MFLQEKENLTRMIIAKLKEMVLRDMHATFSMSDISGKSAIFTRGIFRCDLYTTRLCFFRSQTIDPG